MAALSKFSYIQILTLLSDIELSLSDIKDSYIHKPVLYIEGDYLLSGYIDAVDDLVILRDMEDVEVDIVGVEVYPTLKYVRELHAQLLTLGRLADQADRVYWYSLSEEQIKKVLAIVSGNPHVK